MSVVCKSCGHEVDASPGSDCPVCGQRLSPAVDGPVVLPGMASADPFDRPDVSAMALDDAALLERGGVSAPSQLGSRARVGRFEVIRLLGQGGMGQVYAATEPVTGTAVALKLLRPELAGDERVVHAFVREARHMYQLSHPAILKVLEVSDSETLPFFVMPLVQGGSLAQRISGQGILDYAETLTIGIGVAEGVAHAHAKGLIHRDLKPANVLLGEGGHAYVTDFGLVRSYLGDSMLRPDTESLEGTPAYMSPSVARGQAEDTRCDVYAFGALLYEMLTGVPPYTGRTTTAVLQAVIAGPPTPVLSANPKAPRALASICGWCMARELRDRYASMDDVVADLARVRSGETPRGPHGRGRRPRAAWLVVAGACVAAAVALGVWQLMGAKGEPPRREQPPPHVRGDYPRPRDASPPSGEAGVEAMWHAVLRAQKLGNQREVTELCRDILQRAPDHEQARETMIRQLLSIGHLDPAHHNLTQWLDHDPENETAKQLYAEWQAKLSSRGGPAGRSGPRPERGPGPPLHDE
jgi:hypothetical protein